MQGEPLTEKEIKRQGFLLAETRFNELLPLLSRLNTLEKEQREEEIHQIRKAERVTAPKTKAKADAGKGDKEKRKKWR